MRGLFTWNYARYGFTKRGLKIWWSTVSGLFTWSDEGCRFRKSGLKIEVVLCERFIYMGL